MLKFLLSLALLGLSACVPTAPLPYQGGYNSQAQQPDEYDLPAHCIYDAYGAAICQ